jgi:hypothetical protein
LRADIEGLRITAGIHLQVYRDYHRSLSRIFPYGVFYTADNPHWIAARLMDTARD